MHKLCSEGHIAGFSVNTETENYLASKEFFFFRKYLRGKLFVHSTVQLSAQTTTHSSHYNTLVSSTTCKHKCFWPFIMLYNKFKWLNVYCGLVNERVLGELLRT